MTNSENATRTAEKRTGTPCTCPSTSWGRPICQEQAGNGIDSYCRWERSCEDEARAAIEARYQQIMGEWAVGRLAPK
jgi:hypothetical protein